VILRGRHERRAPPPPATLVNELLAHTRLVELALLGPNGEQAAANVLKVVESARRFGERPGATFRRFVQWLRDNQRRPPRESEGGAGEATGNAVRLMTMHAAKGLEFPVVLLANARTGTRAEACIVDRAEGAVDLRLGDAASIFRTPGYEAAAEREKLHSEAEHHRLLYVACTRARDHLAVPCFEEKGAFATLLGAAAPTPWQAEPGTHLNGMLVYDTRPLWRETPEPPPLRLRIARGPEADAALTEREAWARDRAALWPDEQTSPAAALIT